MSMCGCVRVHECVYEDTSVCEDVCVQLCNGVRVS